MSTCRIVDMAGLRIASLLIAFVVMSPAISNAACSPNASPPQKMSEFLGNPTSLVNGPSGPRDGSSIIGDVRDLVASDPATLTGVINLLKANTLNIAQQQAIGTGLGLAANICLVPDSRFAAEIQTQLADTPSEEAKLQYAAVTGNKPIRAVAAGGGGYAGGSGGGTSGLGNTRGSAGAFQPFLSNRVSNIPTNFFSGGGVSALGSSTSFIGSTSVTSV